jgi:HlyD family secretion protein
MVLIAAAVTAWVYTSRHRGPQPVTGTIEMDEAHLASRYGGRVEKIFAEEGSSLKAGDPIVAMEASELRAKRDQVAATLSELEHGPRTAEIEAAKRDWESLTAQREYAQAEAKRAEELIAKRIISPSDAEKAESTAHSLEKSASAAKARYELLQEGTRPERIELARAQLAEIDAQLREMRVEAPDSCVLEVLSVKLGDVLPANREVATVIMPQHLWVRVFVPEPWLGHIRLGQKVPVRVDAWPGEQFQGEVEQINRRAEFTPRNVQTVEERVKQVFGIKLRLDNSNGKLWAGMSAEAFFPEMPKAP